MKKVLSVLALLVTLAAAGITARADNFAGAIDIAEPCPITGQQAAAEAPQSAESIYAGVTVSEEDERLLRAILWAEANNQNREGQKAVIEVIFNRYLSPDWPDTIYGVLSQKGQFATWKYRDKVTPTQEQADVVREVMAETETVLPAGYVYFDTRGRNGKAHIKIGDHYFGR